MIEPHRHTRLLVALGFKDVAPWNDRSGTSPDLFLALDPTHHPVAIAVERCAPVGSHAIEGALARGWLRLRSRDARRARRPVVVLIVRALGARSASAVDEFAASAIGEEVNWIATDGIREIRRSGGKAAGAPTAAREYGVRESASLHPLVKSSAAGPFSDAMLRCVKALLRRESQRGFPRLERYTRASTHGADRDLPTEAGVSTVQYQRFLRTYRLHGFLDGAGPAARLRQRRVVFESFARRLVMPIRAARRAAVRLTRLSDWLASPELLPIWGRASGDELPAGLRFAVGAHHAADRLGVRAVVDAPVTLYIDGQPEEMAELLDLDLDAPLSANVLLVRPPFSRAVFDFAFRAADSKSWPRVDILQCWLDARAHPLRGGELAAAIEAKFPFLLQDSEKD